MTDLKEKTILVVDEGIFFEAALKMCDTFGRVLYYVEWKNAYPKMPAAVIGSEWKNGKMLNTFDDKNFERIENIFDYIDEIDCAYFPDVYRGDMQLLLERFDIPVFGCKKGEEMELERVDIKQYMKSIGMDVQHIERIVGLDNLRTYLKEHENVWVKISKYRGEFETFNSPSYKLIEPLLSKLEYNLGVMKSIVEFVVEDNIDAEVEEGMDGYTVDGVYPQYLIQGVECKDACYCGMFTAYEDLSEGVKEVNDKIAPLLEQYKYRGFLSTEIRTTKDGKHYQIDWCTRNGFPPSSLYQEMYANFGEIIWNGANGKLINPIATKPYGMEVIIRADAELNTHQAVYFPPEIRQWVKLKNCIKIDGEYYTLKLHDIPEIGSIVAIGDSFEECKDKIEKMAKQIEGYHLDIQVDAVDEGIEQYQIMTHEKASNT